jgi:hypothetical protein
MSNSFHRDSEAWVNHCFKHVFETLPRKKIKALAPKSSKVYQSLRLTLGIHMRLCLNMGCTPKLAFWGRLRMGKWWETAGFRCTCVPNVSTNPYLNLIEIGLKLLLCYLLLVIVFARRSHVVRGEIPRNQSGNLFSPHGIANMGVSENSLVKHHVTPTLW